MTDELAASGAQLEGGRRRAAVPGFEPRSVCPQSFGPSSLGEGTHRICEKHQGFVIRDRRGAGRNPGGLRVRAVKGHWQQCQQLPGEGRARALAGGGHVPQVKRLWRARAEVSLPGVNECASGTGDSKYTSTSFFSRVAEEYTGGKLRVATVGRGEWARLPRAPPARSSPSRCGVLSAHPQGRGALEELS